MLIATLPAVVASRALQGGAPVVIRSSVKFQAQRYLLPDPNSAGAVRIEADHVVVDFGGSKIRSGDTDQAGFSGIGILIDGRSDVTLENVDVSGYQFNILLRNCHNVRLVNCRADGSRAIRMANKSGKPIDTFLNLRDADAWRSYGAGFWLEGCDDCRLSSCRACGAQNGVVLMRDKRCKVSRSDFSFNGGWGVALSGSSSNDVLWNYADFVNRPWAGGWGGDSAGFAVADGSSNNRFIGNSFTHGGDGFFLSDRVNGGFDPQTKTFKFAGSSDGNIVADNDGSWASANAFEGTFSAGNTYLGNLAENSNYGFWLGYSSHTRIERNRIENCASDGIAIEQGRENVIAHNVLANVHGTAVHLWSGTAPEHKTRPSTMNDVLDNVISKGGRAFGFENSTSTLVSGNHVSDTPEPGQVESTSRAPVAATKGPHIPGLPVRPPGWKPYREEGYPMGSNWLRAGEFAPVDLRDDILAVRLSSPDTLELRPVHPGKIDLTYDASEIAVTDDRQHSGSFWVRPTGRGDDLGGFRHVRIQARSLGRAQTIDEDLFSAEWKVRWFNWDKSKLKPDDEAGWNALFASKPVVEMEQSQIAGDFSFHHPAPGVNPEYFAFEASTDLELAEGSYLLSVLPDDGIRIDLDGKTILNGWRSTPGDLSAQFTVAKGEHHLRVRFFQTWGNSYLTFRLDKM